MSDYQKIIDIYKETKSIKDTSKNLNISTVKVRKVLITEGLWRSRTSDEVGRLYANGLSVEEIAAKLFTSPKNVQAYIPYARGIYGEENRSDDAVRSDEYRERMHTAAEKMVQQNSMPLNTNLSMKPILPRTQGKDKPLAFKLHLELIDEWLDDDELATLKRYGKMETAISRDIIIPATMTFHALHYAIQKLFGWQNSHLHHYSIPERYFAEITQNSFYEWCRLCGVLFRYPSDNDADLFWDDDYKKGISVKSWLRSKYNGPYSYGGVGDYYLENQEEVLDFYRHFPKLDIKERFDLDAVRKAEKEGRKWHPRILKTASPKDCTLAEVESAVYFDGNFASLLERLEIGTILLGKGMERPNLKDWTTDMQKEMEIKEADLKKGLKQLSDIRQMMEEASSANSIYDEEYLEKLDDCTQKYDSLCSDFNIAPHPFTDVLLYSYDYGDNWNVKITCSDIYYDQNDFAKDEQDADAERLLQLVKEEIPVCVAMDGIGVLDDVGGVSGFCRFLREIHENPDCEERDSWRSWARSLGWTGRRCKPERML